jgi:hypothetical protein
MVALGGTAYAGVSLPGNSVGPQQIQPGAVRSPDVLNRSLRRVDFRRGVLRPGATGPAGPQGAQGLPGATGQQGDAGPPGPFPQGDLPPGITLRGSWGQAAPVSPDDSVNREAISFGFTLASPPTTHVHIDFPVVGPDPPPECPGSINQPEALPGHLCVYAFDPFNSNLDAANGLTTDAAASLRHGFLVQTRSDCPGAETECAFGGRGSWAVTSP